MTLNRKTIGIVFIGLVLLFSLITLVYWSFVRDTIIVPVYYFVWVGSLVLKSVPQEAYLALFVLVSLIIGVNTLLSVRSRQLMRIVDVVPVQSDSRYDHWRKICSNLYSSPFAQDSFAWETRKLILSIVAYQNGIETAQAEAMIRDNVLSVPEPIKLLIQEKRISNFDSTFNPPENMLVRLRHWLWPVEDPQKSSVDGAVSEIAAYIEHLLEINHA